MTVLQALRMAVGYPLDETALERIVIDRKLTPEAPYTGQTPEFMLARRMCTWHWPCRPMW